MSAKVLDAHSASLRGSCPTACHAELVEAWLPVALTIIASVQVIAETVFPSILFLHSDC